MNSIKSERGTWDRVDWWLCVNLDLPFRIWWHKLWVRHGQDEQHPSLELDVDYMDGISPKRRDAYYANLTRRRNIAHKRATEKPIRESMRRIRQQSRAQHRA